MAFSTGQNGGIRAEMNVTPMIDVLLVLIIIFMVITPPSSRGLKTQVPQTEDSASATPRTDLVITVLGDNAARINQETATLDFPQLELRLRQLFVPHSVLFVRAGKGLDFQPVAQVIDIAKGIGMERVALMTN